MPALGCLGEDIDNCVNVPFEILNAGIKGDNCGLGGEAVITTGFRRVSRNALSLLIHVAELVNGVKVKLISRLSVPGACLNVVLRHAFTLVICLSEFPLGARVTLLSQLANLSQGPAAAWRSAASRRPRAIRADRPFERLSDESPSFGRTYIGIRPSSGLILLGERFVFRLGPLNLFSDSNGKFGQEVAALLRSLFGLLLEQGDLAVAAAANSSSMAVTRSLAWLICRIIRMSSAPIPSPLTASAPSWYSRRIRWRASASPAS